MDETILDAAGHVLAELGVAGFSVDAVAARAGVGKATIYRRWASRGELLLETAQMAVIELPDPDTGQLREDLVQLLSGLATKMRDTPAGQMLPAVAAEGAVNLKMRETLAAFVEQRRQRSIKAVTRGMERGDLPADTDPDLVVDLITGPILVRTFLTQMPIDESLVHRTVDAVLDGLRPRP